jgi:hypothetical protein
MERTSCLESGDISCLTQTRSLPDTSSGVRHERNPRLITGSLYAVLYIPPGVAHGFNALTGNLDLIYWVTQYLDNTDEYGVAWNDPVLSVSWKATHPILSERDSVTSPVLGGSS